MGLGCGSLGAGDWHPRSHHPQPLCHPNAASRPQGRVSEYPVPHSPASARRAAPAPDGRWGSALACNASRQSFVSIRPAADYSSGGGFALSVWIKPAPDIDIDVGGSGGAAAGGSGGAPRGGGGGGATMAYVLSHSPPGGAGGAARPNSVALMLPRPGHPRFGVLRAVLRDGAAAAPGGLAPRGKGGRAPVADGAAWVGRPPQVPQARRSLLGAAGHLLWCAAARVTPCRGRDSERVTPPTLPPPPLGRSLRA